MTRKYIIVFLFLSFIFPYLSIKDKKIHNSNSNQYYSHDQFIESINADSSFVTDTDYQKYIKYHNRLKFKKSWYIYLLSIGSVATGIEGIQSPEKWEEGGDQYDAEHPNNEPPGIDNIIFGGLVYVGYFGYNTSKRNSSVIKLLNKYNMVEFYWEDEVPILESSYDSYNFKNFNFSYEAGIFSEKSTYSIASMSLNYKVIESYEIFFNVGTALLTLNIGFGGKYYFNPNKTYSPFISFSSYSGGLILDSPQYFKGINLSSGFLISSILKDNITLNIGLSYCWEEDRVILLPFIYTTF